MSISNRNRLKKLKDNSYEIIIKCYKFNIDNGKDISDLDFSIFDDERDYYYNFILMYIKYKRRSGSSFFDIIKK